MLVAEADLDAEAEPDPSVLCIVTPRTTASHRQKVENRIEKGIIRQMIDRF